MSRATKIDRYPSRYLEIASAIEDGKDTVTWEPFESKAAANSARLDLYSFRAALERSDFAKDYPRFAAVRMYVRPSGKKWSIVLQHADRAIPNIVKVK